MVIKDNIVLIEKKRIEDELNIKDNIFEQLMNFYNLAMRRVEEEINLVNSEYKNIYKEDLINHVNCRIKTPDSIVKKMNRKNLELTYKNLIENINDIAGVRIICPFKNNVYEVVDLIRELNDFRIIKEKDYIIKPKNTGYSSYHIIVEVPIEFDGTKIYGKVEIQIRTMAMDFWATLEHEIKYKSSEKISEKMSKDLIMYAKIINRIDNKLMKIHNRRFKKKVDLL